MREIHGSAKFVAAARDLITQHQTKWNGNYERKFHSSPLLPNLISPPPSPFEIPEAGRSREVENLKGTVARLFF
jgi:hypothetical protein